MPPVNVKELEVMDDASDILVKHIKPNFKVLGPKYGKEMKEIATNLSSSTTRHFLESVGGGGY